MSIIDKLIGRRKRTATVIADEITKQHGLIAASRARIEAAQVDRKAAIEDLDAARHRGADETIAEEGREIERRERAVGALETAHAEQVAAEAREALDREIAEVQRESAALSTRIRAEYEPAARTLGALARALQEHYAKRNEVETRARELGMLCEIQPTEAFRRGEQGRPQLSLAYSIGHLPALHAGDPAPHPAPISEGVRNLLYPEIAVLGGRR